MSLENKAVPASACDTPGTRPDLDWRSDVPETTPAHECICCLVLDNVMALVESIATTPGHVYGEGGTSFALRVIEQAGK